VFGMQHDLADAGALSLSASNAFAGAVSFWL
jgi:hypothetical protein